MADDFRSYGGIVKLKRIEDLLGNTADAKARDIMMEDQYYQGQSSKLRDSDNFDISGAAAEEKGDN